MQCILRGTLQGRNAPELYAPGPEAYAMLKGAVVGGPSLVFTRKHLAGQTRIRPHKYESARVTKRIPASTPIPSTQAYALRHALRPGEGRALRGPLAGGARAPVQADDRSVVRLRGGGHRSSPGAVGKVRGVSAFLHQSSCS